MLIEHMGLLTGKYKSKLLGFRAGFDSKIPMRSKVQDYNSVGRGENTGSRLSLPSVRDSI